MKTPYSKLSIERLENAVKNHTKSLKAVKKELNVSKNAGVTLPFAITSKEYRKLYLAEWRLKTAKKWLQKRIDERDMKNH